MGSRVIEILPGALETDMLAHSEDSPVEVDHPAYRPMAERFVEMRRPLIGHGTPANAAASAIVETICQQSDANRHSCDPMGAALLEARRGDPGGGRMAAKSRGGR